MITGRVIGDQQVIQRLGSLGPRVSERMLAFVKREAIKVQARTKEKLTGEVLHVRTGTLRRSINQRVQQTPTGVYGIVGTNVVYAPPHEFGFHGTESIREHLRQITQAFGRPISPREVLVRAHTRQVNLPERSFLRSSLAELRPEIVAGLREAVGSWLV